MLLRPPIFGPKKLNLMLFGLPFMTNLVKDHFLMVQRDRTLLLLHTDFSLFVGQFSNIHTKNLT